MPAKNGSGHLQVRQAQIRKYLSNLIRVLVTDLQQDQILQKFTMEGKGPVECRDTQKDLNMHILHTLKEPCLLGEAKIIASDTVHFHPKSVDLFLISPQLCMFWVLIRQVALCFMSINPFILNWLFYLHSVDWPISDIMGVWLVFIITMSYRNSCI